jgi:hypothetical protein
MALVVFHAWACQTYTYSGLASHNCLAQVSRNGTPVLGQRATKNNVFFFYFAAMFFHMSKLTRFSSPSFFISKLCLILLLPNHIVSFHAYFNRIDQP